MATLREDVCRKIEARLAFDPPWRETVMGQLAKSLIDRHKHIPIDVAAEFIGVKGMMLRRWLYGRFNPAARQSRVIERVKLLTDVLDYAYSNNTLPAATAERTLAALANAEKNLTAA